MTDRIVETEYDRKLLVRFIEQQKLPFTASVVQGKHRTNEQNRLQRKWMQEVAEQLGDRTSEEVRGHCKLHFGVPILREENEAFRVGYDRTVKPLSYEQKLDLMMEPLSLPVTSIMNTRQKTAYLDQVFKHFTELGLVLTQPEDKTARRAA